MAARNNPQQNRPSIPNNGSQQQAEIQIGTTNGHEPQSRGDTNFTFANADPNQPQLQLR